MLGNPAALLAVGQGVTSIAQGVLSAKSAKEARKAEEKALKAQLAQEQKLARLAAKQAQADAEAKTKRTRTIVVAGGVVLAVVVVGFMFWKAKR